MPPKKRAETKQADAPARVMETNGWLYFLFIVALSFFTFFYRYDYPQAVFWDEPYHIASAQKYLIHVFFMEQHPPLGKLLIALGEKITHSNPGNSQFIDTDYARNFPAGFSFSGYRLIPALLAWFTAPLLFLIFLLITQSSASASLLSFLYIFANALIVHNRGAMVDSPLIFFSVAMIALFMLMREHRGRRNLFLIEAFFFGITFGLVMTTKLVGLIMILLVPAVIYLLWPENKRLYFFLCPLALVIEYVIFLKVFGPAVAMKVTGVTAGILVAFMVYLLWPQSKQIIFFGISTILGFLIAFIGVWQIHFSLSSRIVPALNNDGYYQASNEYKTILKNQLNTSLWSFPTMIRDSLAYPAFYNRGVPRLDLCKADENGSPFFFWPLGARAINYRWENVAPDVYRYLYLQANPVTWLLGLIGVLLSVCIVVNKVFFPTARSPKHFFLICVFLGMYVSYMLAISQLSRVMYLYHYFAPLIFSYILFALVYENIDLIGRWRLHQQSKIILLTVLGIFIFAAYQFYRPLTYYEPIENSAVEKRAIFPLWELRCVTCPGNSLLVVPGKSA